MTTTPDGATTVQASSMQELWIALALAIAFIAAVIAEFVGPPAAISQTWQVDRIVHGGLVLSTGLALILYAHRYWVRLRGPQLPGGSAQNIDTRRAEVSNPINAQDPRQILERLPCLIATAGADGRHDHANRRMLDYCGLTLEQARGFGWLGIIHPEDRDAVAAEWMRCGQACEAMNVEHRLRRHDGAYRWFAAHVEPFLDDSGHVMRWYGVITDIEERKRFETALENREKQLRTIIDSMPGMVWFSDAAGDDIYISKQLLDYTGVPVGERHYEAWQRIIHPDDFEETTRLWQQALDTASSYDATYRIRRRDGIYRWFKVRGEPVRDEASRLTNWCGVNFDIDDAKLLEDALRSTSEQLSRATHIATVGEMSASIAHEINQPLAAVVTNGDACIRWLDAVPPDIERARQTAVRIVRDGHSAAAVVQHIRSLFKNSAPAKLPLDLSGVLDEVMQLMHNKLRDKFIAVNVDLEDGLPQVFADRVQIQQVLINLLQNAIDAMEAINEGSKVVLIKARIEDPNNMVVHVCDRGVGIANADRIFEPFFTTKQKGLGVGLSISRSIIQSHGGRMWATPGEAGGSVVAFTLPIHSQASDDAGEGVIPPLQRQRD